jgi:hypothetical protein
MENVGIFYDHCQYLNAIGCIWIFVVIWYIFLVLVCLSQENSGNPGQYYKLVMHFYSCGDPFYPDFTKLDCRHDSSHLNAHSRGINIRANLCLESTFG